MALKRPILLIYNLLQVAALPWLGPPVLLYFLSRSKYRGHLAGRLGRLPDLSPLKGRSPRIWVHALSVGEVNAASALVTAISQRWQGAGIICSATTATGLTALKRKLGHTVLCALNDGQHGCCDIKIFLRLDHVASHLAHLRIANSACVCCTPTRCLGRQKRL